LESRKGTVNSLLYADDSAVGKTRIDLFLQSLEYQAACRNGHESPPVSEAKNITEV
jgi:hypothetical protein